MSWLCKGKGSREKRGEKRMKAEGRKEEEER